MSPNTDQPLILILFVSTVRLIPWWLDAVSIYYIASSCSASLGSSGTNADETVTVTTYRQQPSRNQPDSQPCNGIVLEPTAAWSGFILSLLFSTVVQFEPSTRQEYDNVLCFSMPIPRATVADGIAPGRVAAEGIDDRSRRNSSSSSSTSTSTSTSTSDPPNANQRDTPKVTDLLSRTTPTTSRLISTQLREPPFKIMASRHGRGLFEDSPESDGAMSHPAEGGGPVEDTDTYTSTGTGINTDAGEYDGLFFASPSPSLPASPPPGEAQRKGPEDDVSSLVCEAKKVTALNPLVADFMTGNKGHNKQLFSTLIRCQLQLVKGRSPDFPDGQVTVFDKALVELTNNGRELETPAVVKFFCEHYLNIHDKTSAVETKRNLGMAVAVSHGLRKSQKQGGDLEIITGACTPTCGYFIPLVSLLPIRCHFPQCAVKDFSDHCPMSSSGSFVLPDDYAKAGASAGLDASKGPSATAGASEDVRMTDVAHGVPSYTVDGKLERLWDLYSSAKQEFVNLSNNNCPPDNLIPAAKFLRDTAENTLQYVEGKYIDTGRMDDLEATFNMAKVTVVSLTGGKKRKFDHVSKEETKDAPRGPGFGTNMSMRMGPGSHSPEKRTRRQRRGSGYASGSFGTMTSLSSSLQPGRGGVATAAGSEAIRGRGRDGPGEGDRYRPGREHTQAFSIRSHPRGSDGGIGGGHGDDAQKRTQAEIRAAEIARLPPRPPAPAASTYRPPRGHSGIPFGYTRDVDSYQPGKDKERRMFCPFAMNERSISGTIRRTVPIMGEPAAAVQETAPFPKLGKAASFAVNFKFNWAFKLSFIFT
ncbi:hypothetical protein KCU88_g79, partial [Aureobasidium melanogenum]